MTSRVTVFVFFLTMFLQDLKKYHFYYWFCFPALCFSEGIKIVQQPSALEQVFSAKQVGFITNYYATTEMNILDTLK